MSTHRIAPPERFRQPEGRGPNGRRLCRNCHREVPAGKRSWCSQQCVDVLLIAKRPGYVRAKVFERDQGVCAGCALDTEALDQELRSLRSWLGTPEQRAERNVRLFERLTDLRNQGFNVGTYRWSTLWEADHIVPVVEGGGECGLEGYRTLCIPCHKKVTAELRRRLAEHQRLETTGQLTLGPQ